LAFRFGHRPKAVLLLR